MRASLVIAITAVLLFLIGLDMKLRSSASPAETKLHVGSIAGLDVK